MSLVIRGLGKRGSTVLSRALRWPKHFGISQKSEVESPKILTVETGPKINSASELLNFRKTVTKNSKIVLKILTKIRFETPVYIFEIFVITETNGILHGNFENQRYKRRPSI